MAMPPRSMAVIDDSAPESFPIGVRAPETMTVPPIGTPLLVGPHLMAMFSVASGSVAWRMENQPSRSGYQVVTPLSSRLDQNR